MVVWCGVKGGSVGGLKSSHADGLKHAAANICRQPSTTWLREAGASKMGLRCNYCHSAHLFLVPVPRDLPSCLRINERYVRIFFLSLLRIRPLVPACQQRAVAFRHPAHPFHIDADKILLILTCCAHSIPYADVLTMPLRRQRTCTDNADNANNADTC